MYDNPVDTVISARGLGRTFKGRAPALADLSLQVKTGDVLAIVGPNGAGKTTLVRLLATQLKATSGALEILGHDALRYPDRIRLHLSSIPQDCQTDSDLSVTQHLFYYFLARGERRGEVKKKVERLIEQFGLSAWASRKCGELSGGLRRRVLLAMALGAESKIVYLDEPTSNLDPEARVETWRLIAELKLYRTIILTTHQMDEVDVLATHVALLSSGRLIHHSTPHGFKSALPTTTKLLLSLGPSVPDLGRFGKVTATRSNLTLIPFDSECRERALKLCLERNLEVSVVAMTFEDAYFNRELGIPQ